MALYRFNVERMLKLVTVLAVEGQVSVTQAERLAGVKNRSAFTEYVRFLLAGGFIEATTDAWIPTEAGLEFATAINVLDLDALELALSRVPSVYALFDRLRSAPIGTPVDLNLSERSGPTYRTLTEIACLGTPIPGEGFFQTSTRTTLEHFASTALARFAALDTEDGLVSVGAWLESLVRGDGIHPERARRYLDEASAAGLIARATEGSTTDTRHDEHAIRVLRTDQSGPTVDLIHLYRGDFLVPNKSSSSLRLGRPRI